MFGFWSAKYSVHLLGQECPDLGVGQPKLEHCSDL